MKKSDFEELTATVRNLQKQVDFLLKITGLDLSSLRGASEEELIGYYRDAVQLLAVQEKHLTPELMELWAKGFCQFTEYEFLRLQKAVEYAHTWEPFYTLCVRMMTSLRHHKDFTASTDLKFLYSFLSKGLQNLRDSAIIMIRQNPEKLSKKARVLLKEDELEALLNIN